MHIIGVFSIKGGVGKTASAVNLSYLSSRGRFYTLLWDLDPQAASTFYFRMQAKVRGGISKLLNPETPIESRINESQYPYLDILPADPSYRKLDLALDDLLRPKKGLTRLLKPLTADYDHIFLDCPPSLTLLSENIFRAADVLLVPIIPTTLSQRTLDQLEEFCQKNRIKTRIMPFFSMVDRRKKLHRETIDTMRSVRSDLLNAEIPFAVAVEEMGIHQAPLPSFGRGTAASEAFERLWREVRKNLRVMAQEKAAG